MEEEGNAPSNQLVGAGWPGDRWDWYEAYVAALGRLRGYVVRRPDPPTAVPGGGDYGADWLFYTDPHAVRPFWAVQCKVRPGPVGITAVQEVFGAAGYYHAQSACVAAPTTFTAPAVELAAALRVTLCTVDQQTWRDGWAAFPRADTWRIPRDIPAAVPVDPIRAIPGIAGGVGDFGCLVLFAVVLGLGGAVLAAAINPALAPLGALVGVAVGIIVGRRI